MTGASGWRRLEQRPSSTTQKLRCGLSKRRCSRGAAEANTSSSLVPRGLIRVMAVGDIIGRFKERPKARSDTELFFARRETSNEILQRRHKLESKLGKLAAENENLRRNLEDASLKLRDLERQLNYERAFYEERKSLYIKAMRTRTETRHVKTQTYAVDFAYESDQVTSLVSELRAVRDLYHKQKALTTSVCEKYVKMRDSKESVIRKMIRMEEHYQETIQEALTNFDRDRVAFALLEKDGVLPKELHADLAIRCSTMSFNNVALNAALLKFKSEHLREKSSKNFTGDLSIYSILKDTKDLATANSRLKNNKRWKSRVILDEECISNGSRTLGKFVSLPVLVNEGGKSTCKITPLFEIENDEELSYIEEEEIGEDAESNEETDVVEVDCSYKQRRRRRVSFSRFSKTQISSASCEYGRASQKSVPSSVESSSTVNEGSNGEDVCCQKTKANRCESQGDIKEKGARPPRTGSAPDIIQATGGV